MSVAFAPEGPAATQPLQLENTSNEKIAVQISMAERRMDTDGKEEHPSADALFNVFPSQIILEPKSTRTVRVTWNGDKKPSQELAFRLIAEQMPVSGLKTKGKGQAVINILVRFIASVYIEPAGVEPKLEVISVKKIASEGKSVLAVEIRNSGSKHKILDEPRLNLKTGAAAPLVLSGEALAPMSGQNVLAGHTRLFHVPLPANWSAAETTGSITVK